MTKIFVECCQCMGQFDTFLCSGRNSSMCVTFTVSEVLRSQAILCFKRLYDELLKVACILISSDWHLYHCSDGVNGNSFEVISLLFGKGEGKDLNEGKHGRGVRLTS